MKRSLATTALLAALALPAVAQSVSDDVQVTLEIQTPLPNASITGLDDITLAYDGTDISGDPQDEFCIFSPTQAFNLTLTGLADTATNFTLQSPAVTSNINYEVILFSLNEDAIGVITPSAPTLVDLPNYIDDDGCTNVVSNTLITIDFPFGGAGDIDTVTAAELNDGGLYTFSDTLTLTLEPQI